MLDKIRIYIHVYPTGFVCNNKTKLIDCDSRGFVFKECVVSEVGEILAAKVHVQRSVSTSNYHESPAPVNYHKNEPGIFGYMCNVLKYTPAVERGLRSAIRVSVVHRLVSLCWICAQ